MMNLTDVIAIWDEIHIKDCGEIGFCDLEEVINKVVGVHNDVPGCQPEERVAELERQLETEQTERRKLLKWVIDLKEGLDRAVERENKLTDAAIVYERQIAEKDKEIERLRRLLMNIARWGVPGTLDEWNIKGVREAAQKALEQTE